MRGCTACWRSAIKGQGPVPSAQPGYWRALSATARSNGYIGTTVTDLRIPVTIVWIAA